MKFVRNHLSVLCVCLFLAGDARLRATTIDPLTWPEIALGADIIAVVECEVAGGIVAKSNVVESWMGPVAGTAIALRVAVNTWEPQFPIALCGQRYLVAGHKVPPATMRSTTSFGPIPLWWRQ